MRVSDKVGALHGHDIEALAAEVLREGFCVVRGLLPVALMDACNEAFGPILAACIERNRDTPNRGSMRFYIPLPFRPPFYDPVIFTNPVILGVFERLIGPSMACDQFASDTPVNGSVAQSIHSDIQPVFPTIDAWQPPTLIAANFSFIDVTPDHGPFEAARGTHLLPEAEGMQRIKDGEVKLEPVALNRGDVMIRDPRCLHRGTPNVTGTPRPVAVFSVVPPWFYRAHRDENRVPYDTWDRLSEQERTLLRFQPRG